MEPRVALALGGGAARGLAHIGVVSTLLEHGIGIGAIAGTSAGSLIGALAASGMDASQMREVALSVSWRSLVSLPRKLPLLGLLDTGRLESFIAKLIGDRSIDELETPFAAVATDIASGKEVVLTEGAVSTAVQASCSIPGMFAPVELDGAMLVDGGLINEVPGDVAARLGDELPVVGVFLNRERTLLERPESVLGVLYNSFEIAVDPRGRQPGIEAVTVLISPEVDDIGYHELDRAEELIERGEQAANDALSDIGAALEESDRG